jgi:hypothetical protein
MKNLILLRLTCGSLLMIATLLGAPVHAANCVAYAKSRAGSIVETKLVNKQPVSLIGGYTAQVKDEGSQTVITLTNTMSQGAGHPSYGYSVKTSCKHASGCNLDLDGVSATLASVECR